MKVVARHKTAPLVALDNGSIVDTEDLEVIGNGFVASSYWDTDSDVEMDPRWEEIATADAANLGVTERKLPTGARTFRAPSFVRDGLSDCSVDTPLAAGKGLTLNELGALVEDDAVTGPPEDWIFGILNKHEDNPDADEEDQLFSLADPELDYDMIDAALNEGDQERESDPDDFNDDDALVAAIEPPPGDFTKVVYIAIIEEDDTKSVQNLVALVSTAANAAAAFTYGSKGWEEAPDVLTSLQAAAPPPIKQLEDWQTESIMAQISSTDELSDQAKAEPWEETDPEKVHDQPETAVAASAFDVPQATFLWGPDNKQVLSIILAAGGADRNRGNAEVLRRYWTVGKGGAKIRWNTPGDWTRCRRLLSKHLGPRAAGYCQLRHHEMTGMWTGDRAHRALKASAENEFATREYKRQPAGQANGGQFAPGKARDESAQKAQDDPAAQALYSDIMDKDVPAGKEKMASLTDAELVALTRILYSEKTSDQDVVDRRLAVASEMAKRGYDVKDFGARGGGIDSDKGVGQFDDALSQTPASPKESKVKPAPRANGQYAVVKEWEDGSAVYADGSSWDPDTKKYKKPTKTTLFHAGLGPRPGPGESDAEIKMAGGTP